MEEKEKKKEDNPSTTNMIWEDVRQTKPAYEKDFYNTAMQLKHLPTGTGTGNSATRGVSPRGYTNAI